jgi:DNA-directed RNA polymerase specialized sigma24 family protein
MTTITAMDIWEASQSKQVKGYAWKLWGTQHGVDDGLQDAVVYAISRKEYFDAFRGRLTTWLQMILKSMRQRERSAGHRRGTVSQPRVSCPGDDAIPTMLDLCDPEGILMAREAVADYRNKGRKAMLTVEQVLAIRASGERNTILAKRYGVSAAIISDVKNRRTYRGVDANLSYSGVDRVAA